MSTHPTAPGDGADEQVAPTRPLEPVTGTAPDAGGTRQLDDLLDESVDPARADPARADAAGPAPEPSSGPSSEPSSPSWAPTPAPRKPARERRPVRVGTVVWGLVVVACGVVALAVAGGASVDGQMLVIGLLGGAGVALVLGSVVAGVRRRATR